MTQQLAAVFESGIRAHPQDWHMLQRVFMSDLDPARLAASVAKAGNGAGPAADGADAAAGGADAAAGGADAAAGDNAGGRGSGA
jgi:KDO2-lipid IV(A) lauroyltransferase